MLARLRIWFLLNKEPEEGALKQWLKGIIGGDTEHKKTHQEDNEDRKKVEDEQQDDTDDDDIGGGIMMPIPPGLAGIFYFKPENILSMYKLPDSYNN